MTERLNTFKLIALSLKTRRLRLDILSIFIFLIAISSFIIIVFSYYKNRSAILEFSTSTIQRVNQIVLAKIERFTIVPYRLAEATKPLINNEKDVSIHNTVLIDYLFNLLKISQLGYEYKIATPGGNILSVIDLSAANQSHFFNNSSKELPLGSKYALRAIDRSIPEEIWEYKNSDLDTIATETSHQLSYDHRSDFWYETVAAWPRPYWSSYLAYSPDKVQAISVSLPTLNVDGTIAAVISANISLDILANYLSHQEIDREVAGGIFVVDDEGALIIPSKLHQLKESSNISTSTISTAFEEYLKTQQQKFIFKDEGKQYLVAFTSFPTNFEKKWLLMTVVNLEDFLARPLKTQYESLLISAFVLFLAGVFVFISARHISSPIEGLVQQVDAIQRLNFEAQDAIPSNIEEIIKLQESITTLRRTVRAFSRYIPKEIVKTLLQQGKEITLGGEKREATILFSDIENFSTIAESMSAEKLLKHLSDYFDLLSKIILFYQGTIDKYIGDSIMAIWNAPQNVEDHTDKAAYAALKCQLALKEFNAKRIQAKLPTFPTRIGIHTGDVFVGNIGTEERMNYTALGDVVNTAARLQNMNKVYSTSILISETVQEKISKDFLTRPLDFIAVKGRMKRVTIYELMGLKEGDPELIAPSEQITLSQKFTQAYTTYHEGDVEKAKMLFLDLSKKFPDDIPTQSYVKRLNPTTHST
jgi:adenylate cyclase